jgi:aryl-alcohol dehydrogenase-like predicted oxidoreductase
MINDFLHTTLGRTGWPVYRLGFSASYRPGRETVFRAIDEGINYFFGYGFDSQLIKALREVFKSRREKVILATGAYNFIWWYTDIRKSLEKRLRQLGTDYIDVFMFMGVMKPKEFPDKVFREMIKLRDEGKVRAIAISTHNRKFAGELARKGDLDVFMVRYNAAHPGAEQDIFPYVAAHNTGVVAYTATRWTGLLRPPRGWPKDGRIPTAGMAYRYVLSNPAVHVCLTAPRSLKELLENLDAVKQGPLPDEEMRFMREFGEAVHRQRKWFMGG